MACSSSCRTKDHATYGECLRSKNLKTAYMQEWKGSDYTAQKRADVQARRGPNNPVWGEKVKPAGDTDEGGQADPGGVQPHARQPHLCIRMNRRGDHPERRGGDVVRHAHRYRL